MPMDVRRMYEGYIVWRPIDDLYPGLYINHNRNWQVAATRKIRLGHCHAWQDHRTYTKGHTVHTGHLPVAGR